MKKQIKHYVTFWTPGVFVGEQWNKDVDSADPSKIEWPEHAYAFTMHEREDVIDSNVVYEGKPKQLGPLYYHPDSKVETLEQVRANPHATSTLVRNMEVNKWDSIIWTRWNNWPQPFEKGRVQILKS